MIGHDMHAYYGGHATMHPPNTLYLLLPVARSSKVHRAVAPGAGRGPDQLARPASTPLGSAWRSPGW